MPLIVNFLNSKNEQREMSPLNAVPNREMTATNGWLMKAVFRDVLKNARCGALGQTIRSTVGEKRVQWAKNE